MALSLHDNYPEAHLLLGSILARSPKETLLYQVPLICLYHHDNAFPGDAAALSPRS